MIIGSWTVGGRAEGKCICKHRYSKREGKKITYIYICIYIGAGHN